MGPITNYTHADWPELETWLQLLCQPLENRDVPRFSSTPCNKELRVRKRRELTRLLSGGARASNEDHTLRHINPAIVRSGSGSEARMAHSDSLAGLTYLRSWRRQHQNTSFSDVEQTKI